MLLWLGIGLAVGWIACAVFAYGISYAYWTGIDNQYGVTSIERENQGISIVIALFGPIGLTMMFLLTGFARYGLKWHKENNDADRPQ